MNQIRYVPNPEARSRGHLKQSADHVAVGILGEEKNSSGGRGQPRASHPRRWSSTRHQSSSSGSWGGNTWWSTRWRSSRAGHPQRWTTTTGCKETRNTPSPCLPVHVLHTYFVHMCGFSSWHMVCLFLSNRRDTVAYVLLHFIWAYVYQGLRFDVVDQGLRAHSVILSGHLCHLKRGRIQLVNVLHVFGVSNLVRV